MEMQAAVENEPPESSSAATSEEENAVEDSDIEYETGDKIDELVVAVDPAIVFSPQTPDKGKDPVWAQFTPEYDQLGKCTSATCKKCYISCNPEIRFLRKHLASSKSCRGTPVVANDGDRSASDTEDSEEDVTVLETPRPLPNPSSCWICSVEWNRERIFENFAKYPTPWIESIGTSMSEVLNLKGPLELQNFDPSSCGRFLGSAICCSDCAELIRNVNWVQRTLKTLNSNLITLRQQLTERIESYNEFVQIEALEDGTAWDRAAFVQNLYYLHSSLEIKEEEASDTPIRKPKTDKVKSIRRSSYSEQRLALEKRLESKFKQKPRQIARPKSILRKIMGQEYDSDSSEAASFFADFGSIQTPSKTDGPSTSTPLPNVQATVDDKNSSQLYDSDSSHGELPCTDISMVRSPLKSKTEPRASPNISQGIILTSNKKVSSKTNSPENEERFVCPVSTCRKEFQAGPVVDDHVRKVHANIKNPYSCAYPLCSSWLPSRTKLRIHQRTCLYRDPQKIKEKKHDLRNQRPENASANNSISDNSNSVSTPATPTSITPLPISVQSITSVQVPIRSISPEPIPPTSISSTPVSGPSTSSTPISATSILSAPSSATTISWTPISAMPVSRTSVPVLPKLTPATTSPNKTVLPTKSIPPPPKLTPATLIPSASIPATPIAVPPQLARATSFPLTFSTSRSRKSNLKSIQKPSIKSAEFVPSDYDSSDNDSEIGFEKPSKTVVCDGSTVSTVADLDPLSLEDEIESPLRSGALTNCDSSAPIPVSDSESSYELTDEEEERENYAKKSLFPCPIFPCAWHFTEKEEADYHVYYDHKVHKERPKPTQTQSNSHRKVTFGPVFVKYKSEPESNDDLSDVTEDDEDSFECSEEEEDIPNPARDWLSPTTLFSRKRMREEAGVGSKPKRSKLEQAVDFYKLRLRGKPTGEGRNSEDEDDDDSSFTNSFAKHILRVGSGSNHAKTHDDDDNLDDPDDDGVDDDDEEVEDEDILDDIDCIEDGDGIEYEPFNPANELAENEKTVKDGTPNEPEMVGDLDETNEQQDGFNAGDLPEEAANENTEIQGQSGEIAGAIGVEQIGETVANATCVGEEIGDLIDTEFGENVAAEDEEVGEDVMEDGEVGEDVVEEEEVGEDVMDEEDAGEDVVEEEEVGEDEMEEEEVGEDVMADSEVGEVGEGGEDVVEEEGRFSHFLFDSGFDPEPDSPNRPNNSQTTNGYLKQTPRQTRNRERLSLNKSGPENIPYGEGDLMSCTVPECEFKALNRRGLNKHLQRVHHPKMNFLHCEYCTIRFRKTTPEIKAQKLLIAHEKLHKMNSVPFGCVMKGCDKSFPTSAQLKNHATQAHDEYRFRCEICKNKSFLVKFSLYDHNRTAHSSSQLPFPCPHPGCTYSGSKEANLKMHMAVHSNSQFLCVPCGKSYKSKSSYDRHMKEHHGEMLECQFCGIEVNGPVSLKQHELTHTVNANPHPCGGCDKIFSTAMSLRVHLKYRCPGGPKSSTVEIDAYKKRYQEKAKERREKNRRLFGLPRPTFSQRLQLMQLRKMKEKAQEDEEGLE